MFNVIRLRVCFYDLDIVHPEINAMLKRNEIRTASKAAAYQNDHPEDIVHSAIDTIGRRLWCKHDFGVQDLLNSDCNSSVISDDNDR